MIVLPSIMSPFARVLGASTSDSEAWFEAAEQSVMWRSKPSAKRSWRNRWKKTPWIQRLSSQTYIDSHGITLLDWWTSYLVVFRVNHSVPVVVERAPKIPDTSGRASETDSLFSNQGSHSSRTSMGSLPLGPQATTPFSTMSLATWKDWATKRRRAASARRKLVLPILGADGSSSPWSTPAAWLQGGTPEQFRARQLKWKDKYHNHPPLNIQVEMLEAGIDWRTGENACGRWLNDPRFENPPTNAPSDGAPEQNSASKTATNAQTPTSPTGWPTPVAGDSRASGRHTTKTGVMHPGTTLTDAVRQWPTPMAHEPRLGFQKRHDGAKGCKYDKSLTTRVIEDSGLQDQEMNNTNGNRPVLSSAWVEVLMGFPLGWTNLEHWEMPAAPTKSPSPSPVSTKS